MSLSSAVKRSKWFPGWCVLSALLLAVTLAPRAGADDASAPPVFVVRAARGPTLRGALQEIKPDWSVRLGEGGGTLVPGADLLTLRRAGLALPPFPVDEHLILANGDRIPFRTARLVGEKLFFRHPDLAGGGEASLPLAAVSVLWRIAPEQTSDAEKLRRALTAPLTLPSPPGGEGGRKLPSPPGGEGRVRGARTRDVVCLRNGDVVAGVLTGLDGQKVEVEVDRKVVAVKVPQVAYIALNTELADRLRPRKTYARLTLTDTAAGKGGRLSLASAVCTDGVTLKGTTVFGAALAVPLARVAALDLYLGRAVYLSDLKASKYEHRPYLDGSWPFALDGDVAGHDLLLGGSTYAKGIGMHSHGRLTYSLGGGYRRFQALVGLDDRDGRKGSVRVRVLADGKPLDLGADRELTARSGPLPVDVGVEGVRELTLEVEFGGNGDVQDVVDWADARLVK